MLSWPARVMYEIPTYKFRERGPREIPIANSSDRRRAHHDAARKRPSENRREPDLSLIGVRQVRSVLPIMWLTFHNF